MQIAYPLNRAIALEGMLDSAPEDSYIITRLAQANCRFGGGMFAPEGASWIADTGARQFCKPPAAVALDVDAMIATFNSTNGVTIYGPAIAAPLDFDGVGLGGGDGIFPEVPRQLQVICDASGDWDPTVATVDCEDHLGNRIPNAAMDIATAGTNVAYYPSSGLGAFGVHGFDLWVRRVFSITQPAQTGAGGTGTVGFSARLGPLNAYDFLGIALSDTAHGAATPAVGYSTNQAVSILRKGRCWVLTDRATKEGDPVYCRLVIAGLEWLGSFTNWPDGTIGAAEDCARVPNAYFVSATSGAGLALVEINLPS